MDRWKRYADLVELCLISIQELYLSNYSHPHTILFSWAVLRQTSDVRRRLRSNIRFAPVSQTPNIKSIIKIVLPRLKISGASRSNKAALASTLYVLHESHDCLLLGIRAGRALPSPSSPSFPPCCHHGMVVYLGAIHIRHQANFSGLESHLPLPSNLPSVRFWPTRQPPLC